MVWLNAVMRSTDRDYPIWRDVAGLSEVSLVGRTS
jgi:hypothetical protein